MNIEQIEEVVARAFASAVAVSKSTDHIIMDRIAREATSEDVQMEQRKIEHSALGSDPGTTSSET